MVIGESCTDVYNYGEVNRLCPEAPVPVFVPKLSNTNPGMAANVFENLVALGMQCDLITHPEVITKTRYVEQSKNHMLLRVDHDTKVTPYNIDELPSCIKGYAAVIISDYCKGYLTEDDISQIALSHPLTFLDTKKKLGDWAGDVTYIKINSTEYTQTQYTAAPFENNLIVTMGADGCLFKGVRYGVAKREAILDVSGAGDTFLAALAARFVQRNDIDDAIMFANCCASYVVRHRGTSVPEGIKA